jgi:hypothetical protein
MSSHDQDQLGPDEVAILEAVPADGSSIGNLALRVKLRWRRQSQRYFTARDNLVDAGLLLRGRGRGGSVRLAVPESLDDGGGPTLAILPLPGLESALYEPMRDVIRGEWASERGIRPLAAEITAFQGRKGGGLWSRPDIVSIEIRNFPYVPGRFLEVVTFEIKVTKALDVRAVYEALAHRRAATHSYVLAHVPDSETDRWAETINAVAQAARQHGIGVIIAGDPSDFQSWDEVVEAQRVEPDPERLNAFIKLQLSEESRNLILERLVG